MKRSTGPLLLSILAVTAVFAGCSDDPAPQGTTGGSSGSATAGTPAAGTSSGSTAGGTDAGGTGGSSSGTGGAGATAGTAGSAGGGAGGTAGAAAGTAGTGGTPEPIVPTIVLIDNVRLQLKPGFTEGGGGEGGGTGVGGEGAGGAPELGTGGMPDLGMAGEAGVGGEGGGKNDGLPPIVITEPGQHGFFLPFDANVMPFAFNPPGFSPGPGGSEGPQIRAASLLTHDATGGNPGGAVKLTVPLTVAKQQADIAGTFATPANLAGYEMYAEVKLVSTGLATECASAWLYVYGTIGGYANDASGEPAMLTTQHLMKDEWVRIRLDLDGPYGAHTDTVTTDGDPVFNPGDMGLWGIQLNTWGCP